MVACPATVSQLQLQDSAAQSSGALLGNHVVESQEFQALLSSGDVFLHGDGSSFAWAYSCTALEALQVLPALFLKPFTERNRRL
jgi:hypothetical protein